MEGDVNCSPSDLVIRAIDTSDIAPILTIQSTCPEIAQWTRRDYERVALGEMAGWVVTEGERIAGFLVARIVLDEMEILNLAVEPGCRRRGAASGLLQEALRWGSARRAEKAHLEVRASNLAALKFYECHGFAATGRRPRYYSAPIEDALLLAVTLPGS